MYHFVTPEHHVNYTLRLYYDATTPYLRGAPLCHHGHCGNVFLCHYPNINHHSLPHQNVPQVFQYTSSSRPTISAHIHGLLPRVLQGWNRARHSRLQMFFVFTFHTSFCSHCCVCIHSDLNVLPICSYGIRHYCYDCYSC